MFWSHSESESIHFPWDRQWNLPGSPNWASSLALEAQIPGVCGGRVWGGGGFRWLHVKLRPFSSMILTCAPTASKFRSILPRKWKIVLSYTSLEEKSLDFRNVATKPPSDPVDLEFIFCYSAGGYLRAQEGRYSEIVHRLLKYGDGTHLEENDGTTEETDVRFVLTRSERNITVSGPKRTGQGFPVLHFHWSRVCS